MEILSPPGRDDKEQTGTSPVTPSRSHLLLGQVELPLVEFSVSERDDDAGCACRTQTLQVLFEQTYVRDAWGPLPYLS